MPAIDLVLASRNRHKAAELSALLVGIPVRLRTLDEFPGAPEVEEDAPTLEGNAEKKARSVTLHTGLIALADDTGLEVDALDGRPGVRSARYAGVDATYATNVEKLLEEMRDVSWERRGARFRTVIAICRPPGECRFAEGQVQGVIAVQPRGSGGFGYDPVFWVPGANQTFAEMSGQEKNRRSHRAAAVAAARPILVEWLGL